MIDNLDLKPHTTGTGTARNFLPPITNAARPQGQSRLLFKPGHLLRVVVSDHEGYETIVRKKLHSIGSIASIDSSFVYGVVKKTNVFPILAPGVA